MYCSAADLHSGPHRSSFLMWQTLSNFSQNLGFFPSKTKAEQQLLLFHVMAQWSGPPRKQLTPGSYLSGWVGFRATFQEKTLGIHLQAAAGGSAASIPPAEGSQLLQSTCLSWTQLCCPSCIETQLSKAGFWIPFPLLNWMFNSPTTWYSSPSLQLVQRGRVKLWSQLKISTVRENHC